ncbi:cysteine sulfinic acid decarboxylase-like [Styela clava]
MGSLGEIDEEKYFLYDITKLAIEEAWEKPRDVETPVVNFKSPKELLEAMDFNLQDEPTDNSTLLDHCKDILHYSVKTGHQRFFNQLFCGLDTYGFGGQILTDALNGAMYTYETAPVFIMMEKIVLQRMREFVGYKTGNGTMCPGGTYSNMLAINLARYWKCPEIKHEGMSSTKPLVLFTSEQCHYSIEKSAALIGIGINNVISVTCDARGKMLPSDLERKIEETITEGKLPFMVNATAGTTVLGAFDPIEEIASICEAHNIWLHVDAAWGGASLMSEKHKHLCKGIERSDSVTWNPHKLMMVPQQCSVLLVKRKEIMKECHSLNVPYLFQTDKRAYDPSFDVGHELIQCGRKVDVLKFWLMWKAKGTLGFRDQIDKAFDNAKYLATQVQTRKWFKLVLEEPECTNVSFWFVPPSIRNLCHQKDGDVIFPEDLTNKFYEKLSHVAPIIKQRMQKAGTMLITYTTVASHVNFFRMIIINPMVTTADLDFVLDEIEKLGRDL